VTRPPLSRFVIERMTSRAARAVNGEEWRVSLLVAWRTEECGQELLILRSLGRAASTNAEARPSRLDAEKRARSGRCHGRTAAHAPANDALGRLEDSSAPPSRQAPNALPTRRIVESLVSAVACDDRAPVGSGGIARGRRNTPQRKQRGWPNGRRTQARDSARSP